MIKKIKIENFKTFRNFQIELNEDLNIIVGDNETGKSTILEAINLALTGQLNGRSINYEISPYIFNKDSVNEYIDNLRKGDKREPPCILIEIFLKDIPEFAKLKGSNNSLREDCPGILLKIEFNEDYKDEFEKYIIDPNKITTLPTEYYSPKCFSFAFNQVTSRSIPIRLTFIDTTSIKLQTGTDFYIQKIIDEILEPKEKTELSLQYRQLKQTFADQDSLKIINDKLKKNKGDISDKELTISIDISQRTSWESNLSTYLDELPFQFIGKGEQNVLKILLALIKRAGESQIILIEEPENHLSFTTMSKLIRKINEKCSDKQLIIATHSNFVLNKLGIDKVIILSEGKYLSLKDLSKDTYDYFKKLPGYDTLRMVLAKKAILVEGPSDELIVQKAYSILNNGKLPIEDGIDVISVRGVSFKRFLDIAKILQNQIIVITDNDGDYEHNILEKYKDYIDLSNITICYDNDNECKTLESQILKCNDVELIKHILNREDTSKEELLDYMLKNKSDCALKIFNYLENITIPNYIQNAFQ